MNSEAQMSVFFFFNDTATTEIYTLSLHDALPIYGEGPPPAAVEVRDQRLRRRPVSRFSHPHERAHDERSEEHTSELQSPCNLVCRLLLEKKKKHFLPITSRYPGLASLCGRLVHEL